MDVGNQQIQSTDQLVKASDRLALYQKQLLQASGPSPQTTSSSRSISTAAEAASQMSRDPITCHVLNTLTGTPAADLPVTLTFLGSSNGNSTSQSPITFSATTDADGRVKNWTATAATTTTVSGLLSSLPTADSKTNWAVRFEVGPWYEAQGIESFWPEVEVKFTVKGRGREGEEGWRHYHVPVLLGPWNYSTYRGS
ncbi:probable 5-hydroxyisourate hydrolase [Aspergillus udagawae]|uniref:hydroxyisourate hydrolase n=1 Tax=Aspergillus udagawae TaxID=91492 RepID=A0A8H3NSY0_9EURO|nr:probable 5-hydroxyisourate hydrolase [Aspergillus udagawae]GFG09882.1 probable 5-hydroxyisourate hydrolase [Aspergillus udagawae]GFG23323.1 probable 5-hydroxyisourate hydrolase [Aspergillus udagawae]